MNNRQCVELLEACVEGGSNYWAASLIAYSFQNQILKYSGEWERAKRFLLLEDAEGESPKPHSFRFQDLRDALKVVAERYPHIWKRLRDFESCAWDAADADVVLQIAALGKVVYG